MNETLTTAVGYYSPSPIVVSSKIMEKIEKEVMKGIIPISPEEKEHMNNLNKLNELADHFKECEK